MRGRAEGWVALALALALAIAVPARAYEVDAGPGCEQPLLVPSPGPIPANLPGFVTGAWWELDPHTFTLASVDASGAETAIDVTVTPITASSRTDLFSIVPASPLVPGTEYVLRFGPCRYAPTQSIPDARYQVIDEAPPPDALGTLELSPLAQYPSSCEPRFRFDATLRPDASTAPWLSLYEIGYELETERGPNTLATTASSDPLARQIEVACDLGCAGAWPRAIPEGDVTVRAIATPYFASLPSLEASTTATYACPEIVSPPPSARGATCGCALAPRESAPLAMSLVALLVAVVVCRRWKAGA